MNVLRDVEDERILQYLNSLNQTINAVSSILAVTGNPIFQEHADTLISLANNAYASALGGNDGQSVTLGNSKDEDTERS